MSHIGINYQIPIKCPLFKSLPKQIRFLCLSSQRRISTVTILRIPSKTITLKLTFQTIQGLLVLRIQSLFPLYTSS